MKFPAFKESPKFKKFADYRGQDLSGADFRDVPVDILKTIEFDNQTIWPSRDSMPEDFNPEQILEESKNPGLGIKELHERGITGKGINVAIIDQKLDTNHSEYSQNISDYEEIGEVENVISMHGPGVASLLVGQNCGVAPGSKLYYKATPAGDNCNWNSQADALYKIIDNNKGLGNKIRIVSCSLGYPNPDFKGDLSLYEKAIEDAIRSGIIFIDSNTILNSGFIGGGSFTDKEDFDTYEVWLNAQDSEEDREWAAGRVVVPSDYRTIASSWSKKEDSEKDGYEFQGQGGISWSIPYLAGIFALMLQVKNDLTMDEMLSILKDTARTNKNGLRILDPKKAIEFINNA